MYRKSIQNCHYLPTKSRPHLENFGHKDLSLRLSQKKNTLVHTKPVALPKGSTHCKKSWENFVFSKIFPYCSQNGRIFRPFWERNEKTLGNILSFPDIFSRFFIEINPPPRRFFFLVNCGDDETYLTKKIFYILCQVHLGHFSIRHNHALQWQKSWENSEKRQKIIRPFWQKYSHFEKIGEHFLYFSSNFPMIFVSVGRVQYLSKPPRSGGFIFLCNKKYLRWCGPICFNRVIII